ncbi:MAG: hypothetical protein ACRC0G_13805 [Fusobacteriaceae bacterium]
MGYKILSLDQSTSCTGYCISNSVAGFMTSGVIIPEGETSEEKIYNLCLQVEKLIKSYDVKIVSLEGIWLNTKANFNSNGYGKRSSGLGDNVKTLIVLGRLLGSLELICNINKVDRVIKIQPMTWKSSFKLCGKPNQKELAVGFAKLIKPSVTIHDEAEAILMNKFIGGELMKVVEEGMKLNEFKVSCPTDGLYPSIFKYFDKKDFNSISDAMDIKVKKLVKEIIGTTDSGKNKWQTIEKEFYAAELGSLNKELKLQILDQMKVKGFKSKIARLVFEEQYKYVEEGK